MSKVIVGQIFLIAAGCICIFCCIMDFDWFFKDRKALLFVELFGRNGARIVYSLIGVFLIISGIVLNVVNR